LGDKPIFRILASFRRAAVEKNTAKSMERNDIMGNAKSFSSIWDFKFMPNKPASNVPTPRPIVKMDT